METDRWKGSRACRGCVGPPASYPGRVNFVPSIAGVPEKPKLRGVLHEVAFFVALAMGVLLGLKAEGAAGISGAIVFGVSVAAMFGTSALYHRRTWSASARRSMRRLDHAMIYTLIAGTYTPFALLVLDSAWKIVVLAIVWSGAGAAIVLKMVWVDAPKWLAAVFGIALGWVGLVASPQLFGGIGVPGSLLLIAGGIAYTIGAVVYARRRPDPFPTIFGYHEIFHALVIAAVTLQYAVVAFFVLPLGR